MTKEICELAVRKNPQAIEFVPKELQTEELCAWFEELKAYYYSR